MTKVRLKDATNELVNNAGAAWEKANKAKRSAEALLQALKKIDNQFAEEEKKRRAAEKELEQKKLLQQQTKAYTMPDEDEAPAPAVEEPKAPAAPKAEEAPAPAPVKAESKAEEKPAEKEEPRAEVKPAAQQARPANPNGAPAQQGARPQGPYGRPANPNGAPVQGQRPQGPYGRPANPNGAPMQGQRPQGPYGRPANPSGAPVQGQRPQGPYGRPANPNGAPMQGQRPQGPYGRPANPNGAPMQGQRPQGPYGRPANPNGAPMQGQRPQGSYGRPAGQGAAGRPQQGQRPMRPSVSELTPIVEKERVSNYDPNKKNYIRQHDVERVAKNKKQLARENYAASASDDDVVRGGKRSRATRKQPSAQQMMAPIKIEKAYMTADTITVKDLTERIGKPAGEILKKLLMMDIMANINSELDFDTAFLVSSEFGVELEKKLEQTAEEALQATVVEDNEEDLVTRPPVITIMGHVDHGKTSLLDYIRKAHVTTTEAGGITQHIGAYTVSLDGQPITFLDTPGHEAFTAMRARGTQATDIAVLVVAADDGVMPQTIESINHARAAGVPIIVAINKMDRVGADPDRVKQDLTTQNLIPEEWGGDTIMVPVSAITGQGVDQLLEMILLQAEVLQLRANPNRQAKGVIIEAKLDKSRGPLATVLVQNGTLHIGDNIVAGMAFGRVRFMTNDRGERVTAAGPSTAVEIAGFAEVPEAGDEMLAVEDDRLSRQVAQERIDKQKAAKAASGMKMSLDNLFSQIDQGKQVTLNLIIKADVQGSVEAVKQAMEKLSTDEVKVRVLHSAVGAITKDDVNLANAFNAIIIGFNIRPDASARDMAEKEKVDIRLYRIIYQAIEDMEKAMKGMLAPEYQEVLLGHAEVRNTFRITGVGTVAGAYVKDGKMQRNAQVRLLRDNVVVFEGKLSSLKRFKDDAKEVATGFECGISLDGYNDIKEGDIIECFVNEEIER